MTKTEAKHEAQKLLMLYGQLAWEAATDISWDNDKSRDMVFEQLDKQFARMEKLFGYEVGSWGRG